MYCAEEEFKRFFNENRRTDFSLLEFLSTNQEMIVKTNSFNTWQSLKGYWARLFKENITKYKPELIPRAKFLSQVNSDRWQQVFGTMSLELDNLTKEMQEWLTSKISHSDVMVDIEAIRRSIVSLETKPVITLSERLKIMSFRFLTTFETLSVTQKCVLKLSLSNIICISSRDFADEYYRHLPTQVSADLSMLSAPTNITEEEAAEIRTIYQDCRRKVFVESAFVESNVRRGLEGQIGYLCIFLRNKFNDLSSSEESEGSADDEEERTTTTATTRKRKLPSECDLLLVIKEVLSTVFANTKLKWKTGEKTTEATKKMKLTSKKTSNTTCKSTMGRRSDMVLYNKQKLAICVSELKDGSCSSSSSKQQSKSIRCSKAIQAYNSMFGGAKNTWSLDWNGPSGYIYFLTEHEGTNVVLPGKSLIMPNDESDLDQFEETLVALFELKNALVIYNNQLQKEPVEEEENDQIYNSS
ncbi:hypothetical protein BD560DRAFT_493369 [Blakeslea trispora]|nr:hypothetical protein BD560DRAFT_493369 [Blakeslea trispora]